MAISRYLNNDTKKTQMVAVYKSKRLKQIPLSNDDIYVATQIGDRLDLLLINITAHLCGGLFLPNKMWWTWLKDGTILRIRKLFKIIRKETNE